MRSDLALWLIASLSTIFFGTAVANTQGGDEPTAHAEMLDDQGTPVGEAHFRQGPNGTLLILELRGLSPGRKGIHIHQVGTCEDHEAGFQASGSHINPEDSQHGLMNQDGPDAGDLTNFHVHDNGYAWAEFFNARASLDGAFGAGILDDDGAALVIHQSQDDHTTQPIGGAGQRIACGVITAQ